MSGRPTTSRSWILPRCSRRRRPSARKKKSNLPRSAVWARWTNESNSTWLLAAGSLHTLVLLTPGKWAPRMICLRGLVASWSRAPGVAADGTGQAEALAQRPRLVGVGGTRRAAAAPARRRRRWPPRSWPVTRRAQPEPLEPEVAPGQHQVGQLVGRADEQRRSRSGTRTRRGRRARPGGPRRRRGCRRGTRRGRRTAAAAARSRPTVGLGAPDVGDPAGHVGGVGRRDEHDVGRRGGELERHRLVGQGGDDRLALRRPGHDRRALDGEEAALEVDVVQLVAVDEAAGGDVLDDGVVLPAVPQPADDLDDVGGLVEQVAQRVRRRPAPAARRRARRPRPAPTPGPASRRGPC